MCKRSWRRLLRRGSWAARRRRRRARAALRCAAGTASLISASNCSNSASDSAFSSSFDFGAVCRPWRLCPLLELRGCRRRRGKSSSKAISARARTELRLGGRGLGGRRAQLLHVGDRLQHQPGLGLGRGFCGCSSSAAGAIGRLGGERLARRPAARPFRARARGRRVVVARVSTAFVAGALAAAADHRAAAHGSAGERQRSAPADSGDRARRARGAAPAPPPAASRPRRPSAGRRAGSACKQLHHDAIERATVSAVHLATAARTRPGATRQSPPRKA